MSLGAEAIATGHYAKTARVGHDVHLLKAIDDTKDQSYFLYRLSQAQLQHVIFPLGGIRKSLVREIAQEIGLPNAAKKDSTGICFIGERPFREFLNRYLPTKAGPIKTEDGKTVGEHIGLAFYTLGQRKGIGVGGSKDGSGEPWFVAKKDMANNTLYIVQGHDHPWLLKSTLAAAQMSWTFDHLPAVGPYSAKTRYRQTDAPCQLIEANSEGFSLLFEESQWAVTPGQSAVLYDGERCLGGGIITS